MDFIDSRSPQEERREFERSRLIIDVFFEGADLTGVASSKDISPGGLYMNTQADIPEGALLTVRVPFAEGDVVVNAEAVYSNPGRGVGLRFHGLTAESRSTIERALGDG
jgi:hypothetical protein